jgi:hypothetical protein
MSTHWLITLLLAIVTIGLFSEPGAARRTGRHGPPEDGISEATFYNWKKQYAGMGITELAELRQL